MSVTVVQPPRNTVPERSQVFGVAATDVLTCTLVLRWTELLEELIVSRTEERPVPIDRRLANNVRLVDVVILEGIIKTSVGELIAYLHFNRVMLPALGAQATPQNGCKLLSRNGFCLSGKANLHPLPFTQSKLRHRPVRPSMVFRRISNLFAERPCSEENRLNDDV
jgi:hypothetical protein